MTSSKYILVSTVNINEVLWDLENCERIGLDTETYGTGHYDQMFSLQLSTDSHVYFFNLNPRYEDAHLWSGDELRQTLSNVFGDEKKIFYIHNAKFDLRRLALFGIYPEGGVHCTQMCARFLHNQMIQYSLAACLKRIGFQKCDEVEKYIKEHKLYDEKRKPRYYDVPFYIMFKYACLDAEYVRGLGEMQHKILCKEAFYHNDLELQKTAYAMEELGIKIDQEYARKGLEYELRCQHEAEKQLSDLAGEPFRSGPIWLRSLFDRHGVSYSTNPDTGNPIFDKRALAKIEHPSAALVKKFRRHEKYASTYYRHYAENEIVHAFIKLWGTDTGRFSYAEPNLQNVPKEEELDESIPFQVRKCFIPREDFCFVMIDYNQQEYRVLLDYAGEFDLIRKINNHNADVHTATAELLGVSRKYAKTINFGLLYGMGSDALAEALGVSKSDSRMIQGQYFAKLPNVKRLIDAIINKAEREKKIKTWVGRYLHFPNKEFAYAAPNHLIQGGCADIIRMAMPQIHTLLKPYKSNMLLQVHDELLFEIHKSELDLVDPIVNIMENVYRPFNGMKLTCGVDHSWSSWGKRDAIAGKPILKEGL
jgi:DNA polymerase-1